jgi:hypothetical protein
MRGPLDRTDRAGWRPRVKATRPRAALRDRPTGLSADGADAQSVRGPIQGSRAESRTKWREPWKLCKLPAARPPTGGAGTVGRSQRMPYDTDPGDGLPPAETGPSLRQQPPRQQRPGRMDRILDSLSTTQKLLAGLTAVVLAGGGLWAAIGELTDRTNGRTPTPTSQQPPISTTSGPSTSGTTETTTPPSTTSTTLGGEVFRETDGAPVVVASCIDLDSQEPDWGVGSRTHKDLCVSFGALGAASVKATRLAVVDDPPRLEDCEKQTVLRPATTTAETVPTQHLCVRSSDKRWAHVRIAAIDRSASTMSFDIVVWKLPSDP